MKSGSVLASCVILAVIFPGPVHLIVPPKTPVLSGFEVAAIGSYRELGCDASQQGAGKIAYKWYKYSIANGVEDWESNGPIGTSQKYVFNPVSEKRLFTTGDHEQPVSGKYKCRASNAAGTRDSEWADLYVYTQWGSPKGTEQADCMEDGYTHSPFGHLAETHGRPTVLTWNHCGPHSGDELTCPSCP